MYGGFTCMCICAPECFVPEEVGRQCQIPWNQSYSSESPCEWQESNLGPSQEQTVLVTVKGSLQFLNQLSY